jgi:hypothetical protein
VTRSKNSTKGVVSPEHIEKLYELQSYLELSGGFPESWENKFMWNMSNFPKGVTQRDLGIIKDLHYRYIGHKQHRGRKRK